jgi:hypothetical protein
MDYPYIGWVPCINGHLDFGLMKPGISGGFTNKNIQDSSTNHINYAFDALPGDHARRIMLQSKVDWQDRLSPERYDGLFRVFVLAEVAKSDDLDQRKLTGSLYLYSIAERETSKAANHEDPCFQLIHQSQSLFDSALANKDSWPVTRSQLNQYYEQLNDCLNSKKCWRVDFVIECGGLAYLSLQLGDTDPLSQEECYIITRQAYYYLKYSLHSHKHHQSEQDSLTTITRYCAGTDGRKAAALRMLGQLKRELTQIKRMLSHGTNVFSDDALGILSYMASLLTTLHDTGMVDDDIYQREKSYHEALKASFQAQDSRVKNHRTVAEGEHARYRVYFGWFLALTSLFLGIVARPFYGPVPESQLMQIPLSFSELGLAFLVFLLVVLCVYKALTTHMVKCRLDETTLRGFSIDRYAKSGFPLVMSILRDNAWILVLLVTLLAAALYTLWASIDPFGVAR